MNTNQSIEQLENDFWKDQVEYVSSLVKHCHEARKIPVKDITSEHLRVLIGQNISLNICIPLAIELLKKDILVAGDYYTGDLLTMVVNSDKEFWISNPELWKSIAQLLLSKYSRLSELKNLSIDTFLRYGTLPTKDTITLQIDIPIEKISSVAPYISLVYTTVLADITDTKMVSETSSETIEDQGYEMGRKVEYGNSKLGISLTSQAIESSAGVHGEDAAWKFHGLPTGITLTGYSRTDYRGIGPQYIWLVVSSSDIDLLIKTSVSFDKVIHDLGLT